MTVNGIQTCFITQGFVSVMTWRDKTTFENYRKFAAKWVQSSEGLLICVFDVIVTLFIRYDLELMSFYFIQHYKHIHAFVLRSTMLLSLTCYNHISF